MKKGIYLACIGAAILGVGTKMVRLYWLDMPNFMDGTVLIIGGITLLILGFRRVKEVLF